MLEVDTVAKQFMLNSGQSIQAVTDTSFTVSENEICVLLGPSGCGKSTVLRMIAGLESPTSGTISLNDQEIEGPGRERGMVFQNYTSFDWLTVQKNVEYGMKCNGVSASERRKSADHYINLVRLNKFKGAHPSQLSGGMKQRVAIARTLANQPSILLMDEPFGALDAETRWTMQELMISIMESTQTTIVMVTHDIEEAIYLADRIIFFSRHPGTVLLNEPVSFKNKQRYATKETVLSMDGYHQLEQNIMALMREQRPDIDA
jgi:NitT/TauT family transport system ATP-binding protein